MTHLWVDTRAHHPKSCPSSACILRGGRVPASLSLPASDTGAGSGEWTEGRIRAERPVAHGAPAGGGCCRKEREARGRRSSRRGQRQDSCPPGPGSGKPCEPVSALRSLREVRCHSARWPVAATLSHTDSAAERWPGGRLGAQERLPRRLADFAAVRTFLKHFLKTDEHMRSILCQETARLPGSWGRGASRAGGGLHGPAPWRADPSDVIWGGDRVVRNKASV